MASFADEAHASTPPLLPPKSGSHESSRIATPTAGGGLAPFEPERPPRATSSSTAAPPPPIPDPGDQWLPQVLENKSKHDLAEILANPKLLEALTHAPATIHPSLAASHQALQSSLSENAEMASQLADLETRVSRARAATQAQLLSTHALERQWRQKQSEMDHALAPFSPASLYQQLAQGVQEQAQVCQAMEESFVEDGDGGDGPVSEREAADWLRRYREAKVAYYLRQERKERWDEGRVGGWR
ncbi:hypothetical protein B0I35DRAFT_508874 [Stachybotrys elegans]|uniref:VPS37 C-terminal domain-containing protein n=1 Tax=Stachybotrys elegans TaxID=80388 RepID=A0A8K0WVZ6_9HYPO|nr:hypothetical protein B0I35DRAFT_508874 [Stachybotrys elegans]